MYGLIKNDGARVSRDLRKTVSLRTRSAGKKSFKNVILARKAFYIMAAYLGKGVGGGGTGGLPYLLPFPCWKRKS